MNKRKRRAIIVLGMHRSGTSAMAGVLGLLGAKLPFRLMPAGFGNPKGYFEPRHVVEIHDRILAAAGTTWANWDEIPDAWFLSESSRDFVEELAVAVSEDYTRAPLFMVKDPRMCRLMPLWYRVLERIDVESYFVIPLRNPMEIAQSLQKRDKLPLAHGCLMWLRYVLDAERQTRGHPRFFLRYRTLLDEPRTVIDRMGACLGIEWPRPVESSLEEIKGFLDPSLRTQIADEQDIEEMENFSPWLGQTYESQEALVLSPNDKDAIRRLDNIHAAFSTSDAVFTPLFKHQAEQHATELAALRETLTARQQEFANVLAKQHATDLAELREELTARQNEFTNALAEKESQITAFSNALFERNKRLATLHQTLDLRDRSIAKFWSENAAYEQSLHKLKDDNKHLVDAVNIASQRLKLIEISTMWQASLALRRTLAVLPIPIRRYGRNALTALWWLLTPHRIPARLRDIRARRYNSVPSPKS